MQRDRPRYTPSEVLKLVRAETREKRYDGLTDARRHLICRLQGRGIRVRGGAVRNALLELAEQGGVDAPELARVLRALDVRNDMEHHGDDPPMKDVEAAARVILDDAHPTLHPSTYERPDGDVHRVIQDLQTSDHVLVFMVVPEYPAYLQIERALRLATGDRKVVVKYVPKSTEDAAYDGLRGVEWTPLMRLVGETVSITSKKKGNGR